MCRLIVLVNKTKSNMVQDNKSQGTRKEGGNAENKYKESHPINEGRRNQSKSGSGSHSLGPHKNIKSK